MESTVRSSWVEPRAITPTHPMPRLPAFGRNAVNAKVTVEPFRQERKFRMQRPCLRKSGAETTFARGDPRAQKRLRKSRHKRAVWACQEKIQFGGTGWWARQGSNL